MNYKTGKSKTSPEMNVGIMVSSGKSGNREALKKYAEKLAGDVKARLEEVTDISWFLDITDPEQLENDNARGPADFLDSASLRMTEGPYDMVAVITDVPLKSRKNRVEAGLASSVVRMIVISTRKLTTTGKKQDLLKLEENRVHNNSVLLFLHLTGHILGLKDTTPEESPVMGATGFNNNLTRVPSFSNEEKQRLKNYSAKLPEKVLKHRNIISVFLFHLQMVLQNPKSFILPLLKNKAIFLPLSLPGLATAAVAPGFLLVFTAEIWDVGFGMSNTTATLFAIVSIVCASLYLVNVQSLFLPRKEKRVLTEHLAVSNGVIYISVLLTCIGLFLMMIVLWLIIEIYVFPAGLMKTWPTLERVNVVLTDKIRLAAFISTIGVVTGALAGEWKAETWSVI